jgi:CheY-like chemotaxis protein/nitrogen-specific signal transduction histidine kinase
MAYSAPFDPPQDATPDELRGRLRALAALIASAPVPIAVAHDPECRYISANQALARLLGVPADANISLTPPAGQEPPYRIQRNGRDMDPDDLPMQYAIAHRQHVTNDIEIVRTDGTVVYVQNDIEPLYDAHGVVCGCVSVCFDMTERKLAEDLLREAGRVKDEFLATLSHELRNPLAPIRNALALLRRTTHDPARTERALAVMDRQLNQLVRLTDDLLDVSRITRNRLELRRERIDLRVVVQSAVETTQPLLDAAGHMLGVELPDTPLWADADFTRLAQAFANLLNNAVKYTDRGGRIDIAASHEDGAIAVRVSDTGIGIAPDLLPRVFDMFMQLDHSAARARGGLGIGLTLARRLVDLHGGTIEAHSAGIGAGTTFEVRLPAAVAEPDTRPAPVTAPPGGSSCRVLIAEDIPDAAEMMRLMVEYWGHDVRIAADGVQAVDIARSFNPQVVLLDIGMPRMDGYEAARHIRAALGSRVTLVALTGWGQEEDRRRARAAGFDHHLTKPADPNELEALIADAGGATQPSSLKG